MHGDSTLNRLIDAALELFIQQGVKRTGLTEVAHQAGLTRVTVYRYFGDKRGLVAAVCERLVESFQRAAAAAPAGSAEEIETRLNTLGEELAALPPGNLLARLDEIRRLYPDVYEEYRSAREAAVDTIFQQALRVATREGVLREGLNIEVVKTVFRSAVVGLIENPAMISANVPLSEIVATVTNVFRHGILQESMANVHQDQR